MKELYDDIYLDDTLYLMTCNTEELEKWSVHNNDKSLVKIKKLQEDLAQIKEELK